MPAAPTPAPQPAPQFTFTDAGRTFTCRVEPARGARDARGTERRWGARDASGVRCTAGTCCTSGTGFTPGTRCTAGAHPRLSARSAASQFLRFPHLSPSGEFRGADPVASEVPLVQARQLGFDDFVAAYNSSTLCGNHS